MSAGNNLFGAYDIRGIYGQSLNESFARALGSAYGQWLSQDKKARIVVGHDSRSHSPSLAEALIDGLLKAGHDVVSIGVASTPMVAWYGATFGFDGSVSVTASHLAKEFNGFKLYKGAAVPIGSRNGLKEIEQIYRSLAESNGNGKAPSAKPRPQGRLTSETGYPAYIEFLSRLFAVQRKLKVAIDVGHGAAAPEIALLIERISQVEFFPIALNADGRFPMRSPNPLDDGALNQLRQVVLEEGCDFGVAFDGDADRSIFVDESGNMVETDLMIGLVGGSLIEQQRRGPVPTLIDLASPAMTLDQRFDGFADRSSRLGFDLGPGRASIATQ